MIFFLVLQPGKPGLEVFVTEGAFKGPLLGVQDHVLLQMRPAAESLQTNSTFPAFTLPLPLGKKLLDVVWMKPPHMLGQGFLAGMEFVTEGAFVLLLLEGSVAGVLLLVYGQVRLGGVALKADVTLEWFLSGVNSGVTLILPCAVKGLVTFGALESLLAGNLDDDWSQTFRVHWTLGRASCCWYIDFNLSISLALCPLYI